MTGGVVWQVRRAVARKNRLATLIGFLLGGFVPLAIYVVAHGASFAWSLDARGPVTLVVGGLLYSAQTVYQWARLAFTHATKAVGFVVLLEGVMVTAQCHWLALAALTYLVVINGVATGCTLAIGVPLQRGHK